MLSPALLHLAVGQAGQVRPVRVLCHVVSVRLVRFAVFGPGRLRSRDSLSYRSAGALPSGRDFAFRHRPLSFWERCSVRPESACRLQKWCTYGKISLCLREKKCVKGRIERIWSLMEICTEWRRASRRRKRRFRSGQVSASPCTTERSIFTTARHRLFSTALFWGSVCGAARKSV